MRIACPSCDESYEVDAARLPGPRVRTACLACGDVLFLRRADGARGAAAAGWPGARAAAPPAGEAVAATDEEVPIWTEPRPLALEEALEVKPAPEEIQAVEPEPVEPVRVEEGSVELVDVQVVEPAAAARLESEPAAREPGGRVAAPPATAEPAAATEGPAGTEPSPAVEVEQPATAAWPVVEDTGPATAESAAEPVAAEAPPYAPATPVAEPQPGAGAALSAAGFTLGRVGDVSARAQRLARALISDILVYHPRKVEQGLREGNLRELVREEIEKSWDEYCERLGADEARANRGHFVAALNEILARGNPSSDRSP